MIYLISYLPNILYNPVEIHDFITNHLNPPVDWWHYANVYLLDTSLGASQIANSLRIRFPNLQHFIVKVDLEDNGGLLPKEAWDWINRKTGGETKLKSLPSPTMTGLPPINQDISKQNFTLQELLAAIEKLKKS